MITKITITTLFILNFNFILYSQVTQEWVARYNGPGNYMDWSYSLTIDGLGNIYVTGASSVDSNNTDYATIKYDKNGNQIWSKLYNGTGDSTDQAYEIVVDRNYNVYVTGRSYGNGTDFDIVTIKYSSSGKIIWLQRYNSYTNNFDEASHISIDDSGNVFVSGNNNGDMLTIKYNSTGILQWAKRYDGPGNNFDYMSCMEIDKLGNVYITGTCTNKSMINDCVTIKYNSLGIQKWIQIYNGPYNYEDYSICLTLDVNGNVYITGETMESPFKSDCVTIKYDSLGNQLWSAIYNSPFDKADMGCNVKVDELGNVYVAAQSLGTITANDFLALKYNSSGVQQWALRHHEYFNDIAVHMVIDKSGNMYISGTSQNFEGYFDFFTMKCSYSGVLQWTKRYEGSSYYSEGISGLIIDSIDNLYITGGTGQIYSDLDFTTIKYSQTIGINPISSEIPSKFSLSQNYPNPFNPATKIKFEIPNSKLETNPKTEIRIYDILGREIATLVNEQLQPGTYEVEWDGSNYPSGVYLYRIQSSDFGETKKMILLK